MTPRARLTVVPAAAAAFIPRDATNRMAAWAVESTMGSASAVQADAEACEGRLSAAIKAAAGTSPRRSNRNRSLAFARRSRVWRVPTGHSRAREACSWLWPSIRAKHDRHSISCRQPVDFLEQFRDWRCRRHRRSTHLASHQDRGKIERARSPRRCNAHSHGDSPGDSKEPASDTASRSRMAPAQHHQDQEGHLERIVGVVAIAKNRQTNALHHGAMPADQHRKGCFGVASPSAGQEPFQELAVSQLPDHSRPGWPKIALMLATGEPRFMVVSLRYHQPLSGGFLHFDRVPRFSSIFFRRPDKRPGTTELVGWVSEA